MKTTLEYLQSITPESSDIICVAKLRGRRADPKEASQIVRERIKHRISVVEDVLNELHNCCKALDHTEISCAIVNTIADKIVNDAFTKLVWDIKEKGEWSHSLFSFTKSTICYVDYNLKTYYVMVHVVTNFGVIEAESYLMDDSFAGDDVLSMLLTRKPIRQKNRSRKGYSKSAARAAMNDTREEGWVRRK